MSTSLMPADSVETKDSTANRQSLTPTDEKSTYSQADVEASVVEQAADEEVVLHDERDIVTHIISVEDDPSLNPWTVRSMIIGLGLSAFGGVLAQIYYFKPQTILVSLMFLGVISYVLGIFMASFIPRKGLFRYLNPASPFPDQFTSHSNIFVVFSANSALATEVLAVQRLYYNITPNADASIFLLFASQLLGYGISGLMRSILLYPSKMLYPGVLPLISMFDALFQGGISARKKLRVFTIVFWVIFIWELFPEWIFPLITGFSIICLAVPNNAAVSRLFGGSNGNEGLGVLSICLDWQYISGGVNPMVIPLKAQLSNFIGYILCLSVFSGVYYMNIWKAQNFPFLSQLLFYENGTPYNQTLILNANYEVDPALLAEQGLPWYAATWVVALIATNLGLGATFTHLLLFNYKDMSLAWSWASPTNIRKSLGAAMFWRPREAKEEMSKEELEALDPHYREMLKYPEAPNSWYLAILIISVIISLVVIYKSDSTLPWWSYVISVLLASVAILFFGALYAITGLQFVIQGFVQMIGGFINPGKPMANMYFVLFSYNSVLQSQLLLRDLKIAQYAKLPPRAAFTAQTIGTLLGAVLNYILMNSIIDNQRDILLSVQGTNIWSGQQAQQYNSQAIAWGGLSHQLFAVGQRYQWVAWSYVIGLFVPVPFWVAHKLWPRLRSDYLYTPVICYYIGYLCVGINSSILSYFTVGFLSQWWLRTRHPKWFNKYNYIIGAALDGGTQVMVFILSFAVQGAAGESYLFKQWWGANQLGNYDYCKSLN
ncbi:OPT oligopeptide transporter [Coniophora puteana RWD-64-598 SS2]|uniref:OPT oligopeptide transporter n=1 Tax=Coniophora puteana (strain RWD-64-598) TaxID=741705 RepID=R7SCY7_CONPW|nr:OPT oligopeptide transporter [Coniophora puteana RWD-64-598 SS2]EIW74041.1 OPT oligopeptide transporter [Coniophora puteana RWD-64-598 SS2]